MEKTLHYMYLGENGTILSPVKLEGIYSVRKYQLTAGKDKMLTRDGKKFYSSILIPAGDLELWYEIDAKLAKIN